MLYYVMHSINYSLTISKSTLSLILTTMQILKVWDICTGKKISEFSADMGQDVTISAMDVDKAGKRYINIT